ncbi:hypothetical protein QMK19_19285 [Streptomyces sp. H10-C2]|uniref:hypothetical protein n=1 Tax=unclassified Streptomyces TaxID=2593676 RepID=UPI0024BB1CFF|nr:MULTISPECIES: hypothetical protein [unclassified Streptomyces]MDJ0346250.1 hypothetical protein [Streptomyces sp. PH10-H1]MDJ0371765.1 hypothetical protein [Streptomyces sp. H10-C2]
MTTNRARKDVIRDRMAATGETYNVAARNLLALRHTSQTAEACRVQRWRPASRLDLPCPCGSTCEPGEKCGRCHALHRHVSRNPGSLVDVEVWEDQYDCTGCSASYVVTVILPDSPWGVVEMVPQGGVAEPVPRARLYPGVVHPRMASEVSHDPS